MLRRAAPPLHSAPPPLLAAIRRLAKKQKTKRFVDINQIESIGEMQPQHLVDKMEKAVSWLNHEYANIKLGRAAPTMLEKVHVTTHDGPKLPMSAVAKVIAQTTNALQVTVFDASNVTAVAKAIEAAQLDLNPEIQGKIIRVPVPRVTREVREELAKQVRKMSNDSKVAVRSAREQGMKNAKKMTDKDEGKRAGKLVQELHDQYIEKIDEAAKAKEKQVLEI